MKIAWIGLVVAGALAVACGSKSAAKGAACVDHSGVTGTVSFKTDVIPIFQVSCSLSDSCHTGSTPQGNLYLGEKNGTMMTAAQIKQVYDGLINRPSCDGDSNCIKESSMKRVVPNDPANSFLIAKVQYADVCGDCAAVGATCVANVPNVLMPSGNTAPMPQDRIDVMVKWIKGGAKND